MGSLLNLTPRQYTLVFVIQEARQLDVNIVSQIYLLGVKELSELSRDCGWPQLWPLTVKGRTSFQPDGLGRPAAVDLGLLGERGGSTKSLIPSWPPSGRRGCLTPSHRLQQNSGCLQVDGAAARLATS